uniref:Winged helix-turn-helix transcriptional regulator n=1 Tax=Prevotella sp. GTC17259 TaxID=3236795 RepID=A0AB33J5C9_9BACT
MKTAVILAARKEQYSSIPYPLKPFETGGELSCLFDRILNILRENSFEHIFVVVGYKKELFEKYASKNLHLIYNKDYEFTSSMGSLAVAEPYIKDDFILIESDTFFEKKVIDELAKIQHGNCFTITEESGSGDEAFVQLKQNHIQRISKDRHQISNIDGEMIGITRIARDTYYQMCREYEHATNLRVNYEYLLLDNTDMIDRPCLRFNNLIWGEVDNADDFLNLQNKIYPKLCRKENPYDRNNLLAHLQTVFPDELIDDNWTIEQIGGMSNKNFKVTSPERKEYVLRVPGVGSEGMVERSNEDVNGLLGCQLGLNPTIRYFNDKTGIKLSDFIYNAETLNSGTIQRMSNMKQIAEIFKTLHSAKIRMANEFNVFQEIVKYERLNDEAQGFWPDDYQAVRERVMSLEHYLNTVGVELTPCHNDLVAENFIKDEQGKIYLIDWEYSGMNDPMADFAALFLENNFSEENISYVLDIYYDGHVETNSHQRILAYQILWDFLWAIWTWIKEAQGDDFGTYGMDRYQRAIENLQRLN